MPYPVPWIGRRIATQATFQIASPPCDLIQVVVNTGAASAVATVYDGLATSNATELAVIDCSAVNNFFYGISFQYGILVVTSGANPEITVVYASYAAGGQWGGYYDGWSDS